MKVDVKNYARRGETRPTMYTDDCGSIVLVSDSDPDNLVVITPDGFVEVRMFDEYSITDLTPFKGCVTLSQE